MKNNQAFDYTSICSEYSREFERFLEELRHYLSFPSISSIPAHDDDCRKCGQWLVDHFCSIGLESRLIETDTRPFVFAEWKGEEGAPIIIIYGHFDIQPVGELGSWMYDPFGGIINDGRLYARGARDNKGQHFFLIKAIEALIQRNELRCGIKFVLDGEEESGSSGLLKKASHLREELRGDVLLACETAGALNGDPAIIAGLRGIAYSRFRLHGASRELHSGNHGGRVPNPACEATRLFGGLRDPSGRITIEGFYKDVREPTREERYHAQSISFHEEQYLESLQLSELVGEKDYTPVERVGFRPSLDIHGISSGHVGEGIKTSIPRFADIALSMRLVSNQDPDDIMDRLREHLFSQLSPGYRLEELEPRFQIPPLSCDIQSNIIRETKKILETYSQDDIQLTWVGASLPVIHSVVAQYDLTPLLVGFGLEGDNEHGVNESFSLEQFRKGFIFGCLFFQRMSSLGFND
jgi:acetylornithine deacetylase/succinyl-diaminopimelate desuccinylase-like protein